MNAAAAIGGSVTTVELSEYKAEITPFVALVKADADFATSLVPVGNGEFLAARAIA